MNRQSARQVTGGLIHMLRELESSYLLSWDNWRKGECDQEAAPGEPPGPTGPSVCGWLSVFAMKYGPGDFPG